MTPVRPASAPGPVTASARLRYRFDNAMSRGPFVVIAYLGALSVVIMVIAALVAVASSMVFAGGNGEGLPEAFWQAMLRMLDAGTFAAESAWPTRLLSLLVTVIGIFLAGSLIGLIANAVDQKVEELRRGRSPVLETGHTLILGWSEQVPRIVSELVIANESEKNASVVVLARADKSLMEDTLRDRVPETRTTRVVCRSGNPAFPDDLERVAVQSARSVIVVRDEDGDAGVVKAVLAIRAIDPDLDGCHVVAELAERDNSTMMRAVTRGRVLTVSSDDVVAEVTAQACLQAGLSAIFTDLLDFDGDEIYFADVDPQLQGRTYGDALVSFEECSVLGVVVDGVVALNPPTFTELRAGDRLVLVAADDSAVAFTGLVALEPPAKPRRRQPLSAARTGTHIVVIGWSSFGSKVLRELDEFLPAGSNVDVVIDRDLVDAATIAGITMEHAAVTVHEGDGSHGDLLALADGVSPEQIMVLGYRDALSVDDADARTLLTLLGLRMIWPAAVEEPVRIVAELLDQRNLVLAAPAGIDDLIVSNALSSLLMAQLSEHAELQAVFDDLFDADGAVVEMRQAAALVPAEAVAYRDVVAAAAATGASAFGYRLGATGAVTLNPPKSTMVTLGPDDQVALIANVD